MCGTDACTYPNPCLMLKHVCKTGTFVRMRYSGPCSVNPDHCPCIQFSTKRCHPTVYLNSCALKKLASHAQTLLQCSRYTIERFLHAYRRHSQYSVEYARIHHALEVLDELDVAHFYNMQKEKVAFVPKYHLKHLANEGEVRKWAAIVDALSVLNDFDLLCHIPSTLPSIRKAFNNSIVLSQCSLSKSNVLFYRDRVRLTKTNAPHYRVSSESLYIRYVRPVDEGTFTCVSSGQCSQSNQTILRVVGKFCTLSPEAQLYYIFYRFAMRGE